MIIAIFNGNSIFSCSYIRCYFQYILLFRALCYKFEKEFLEYCRILFSQIEKNNYDINRNLVPDLGNILALIFFSNYTYSKRMQIILYHAYQEFLFRQMYGIFHDDQNRLKMKQLILKNVWPRFDDTCLTSFEKENFF